MQSKSVLVLANRQCAGLVFPLLDDLKSAALVSPISGSGNHAHWLLGHLVFSEGRYREMMQRIPNPCQALQDKFGGGSQPDPYGTEYPQNSSTDLSTVPFAPSQKLSRSKLGSVRRNSKSVEVNGKESWQATRACPGY